MSPAPTLDGLCDGALDLTADNVGSREALRSLLSACTRRQVAKVQVANNDLIPAHLDAKAVRLSTDIYLNMKDYYRDPTLRVDADALERMQAFQIKAGFQKKSADVRSLVDLSYLPQ